VDGVGGEKVGAEGARLDQSNSNPERCDLLGQAFGEALKRKFGSRIDP
jgi:hypothetical protein